MGFIYKITNSINDKVYIGKTTKTIEKRWRDHIYQSKRERQYNSALYNAMSKYGVDMFRIDPIEECSNDLLDDREKYWIAQYNSNVTGYNLTSGGDGHSMITNEEVQKTLELWNDGLTQQQICEVLNRCCKTIKHIMYDNGITRQEVRKRQNEVTLSARSKPIYAYDLDGNFLREYSSLTEAAKDLNVCSACIGHAADENFRTIKDTIFRRYKTDKIYDYVPPKKPMRKRIYQYALTGEFLKSFRSISDARKEVGLKSLSGIRNSFTSQKTQSGGYQWRLFKTENLCTAL